MKRLLSVILFIPLLMPASLFCQSQAERAQYLIKTKKYNEAIQLCQDYLRTNPRDEEATALLAKAFYQAGMIDSAEAAARRAILMDDETLDAYAVLAHVQLERKQLMEAYTTAQNGIKMIGKKQPKHPPLLVALGKIFIAMDSVDAALIAGSQAKELDPSNAAAYEIMGDAYSRQKVTPMAISSYEQSLAIDSVQPQVLYKEAQTYIKDRQYTDAARVYNHILNLDPQNDASRLELARLYYRAKLWAQCAATLKEYIEKEKNPAKETQMMYLEALLRGRYYKEAAQMGQDILKIDPSSPLAHRAIANGYYNEKKYAQAADAFKKIDTLEFEDYRWLGAAYKQLKKDTMAASVWAEGIKDTSQPLNIRSFYTDQIASIWMSMREYNRAADFYQQRIALDSSAVGAYINYAQCLMQLERFSDAVLSLRTAISKNPKIPSAYVTLGFCYFQMKNFDAGTDEFWKAIKVIDTAEVKYRIDLADSYRMIGLSIMLEKMKSPEESEEKYKKAIGMLKKSIRYKDDVAQTHLLLGQCYQNTGQKELAIAEYKIVLKLDPKNKDAKKGLEDLVS